MRSRRYLKIIVLPIVFLAALFLSYNIINHETAVEKEELSAAVMPAVFVSYGDSVMNEMHGHASEMDPALMRGVITPITNDYRITVDLEAQQSEIAEVRYRVLRPDGSETLDEGTAESLTEAENGVRAEVAFSGKLTDNTDYVCELCVTGADGRKAWYYTRIANYSDAHFDDCLELALKLHGAALKGKTGVLSGSMEPAAGGDNDDLSYVDINSSLDQICFGELGVSAGEPVVTVQEVNNEYSLILLNYMMTRTEDEETEFYEVSECYRLRYSTQKVYLLNFDRTMERLYLGSIEPGSSTIGLGIRPADVAYSSSESGNMISFVQNGQLWEFSMDDNTVTRVYGFRAMDGTEDAQNDWKDHEIRILRTDESGSLDFAVIGYQNRGEREGRTGIGVFHYDSASRLVQELIFLEQKTDAKLLKEEIGSLAYLSGGGIFYFSVGDQVWAADAAEGTAKVFLDSVGEVQISGGGRYLAWTGLEEGNRAGVLHVTDLEHGKTVELEEGSGSYFRPLGFLENDCIYGVAAEKDLERASYDPDLFPMSRVVIYDCEKGEQLKEYSRDGYFYAGAGISQNGNISLQCLKYKGGRYAAAAEQSIKNQDLVSKKEVTVDTVSSEPYQTQVQLRLLGTIQEKAVRVVEPEFSFSGMTAEPELLEADATYYYVCARGGVSLLTADLAEAVTLADETCGVVADLGQRYIWSRAKSASRTAFSVPAAGGETAQEKAVNSMLAAIGISGADAGKALAEGQSVYEILQSSVTRGEILDLTGCSPDLALYYVSAGYPVYYAEGDQASLINGYSTQEIYYHDFTEEAQKSVSITEAKDPESGVMPELYAYLPW